MPDFVRFPLADGGSVVVEVEVEPGLERASVPSGVLRKATTTFEHALSEVRTAAGAALAQFRDLGPDEVELKFGVKLDAQAGAVIARTGLQGQFEVKLKWVRGEAEASTAEASTAEASTEDKVEEVPVANGVASSGNWFASTGDGVAEDDFVAGDFAADDFAAGGSGSGSPDVP